MTRALVSIGVLVALAPGVAVAQSADDPAVERLRGEAARASETAPGRASSAAPAPWLVSTPTALFDRPTLKEAFKVSTATTDRGQEYSMALSPASFTGYATWWTEGLQAQAAYDPAAERLSFGGKWSLNWRDARVISRERFLAIDRRRGEAFDACLGGDPARMAQCQAVELAVIHEGLNAISAPALSLAIGGQRDFKQDQWGDLAANLSADCSSGLLDPVWSVVANLDYQETAPTAGTGRSRDWRAGLQAIYQFALLEAPTQLGFGAKYVQCFERCTGDEASVLFGPTLEITLAKDTQVGASVSWKGSGGDAQHAFTSLALSYSFDSPFGKRP